MDDSELHELQIALGDRYHVKRRLGSGGMATVYLAEDVKHRRDLAIKVLKPDLAAILGPDRFRREVEIAARLNHPHIISLIDSGETESFLYYVMPYIEGDSLRGWLKREKQLPIELALRITEQVAAALDYAHRRGIVHRDIKPENILIHEGEALVSDFGIALVLQSAGAARLTQTGISIGTPEYMSPEQGTGEAELDARGDLYSLACVLYELLVGEPPYTGPTARAVLVKSLSASIPSARRFRDAIPMSVDTALQRAMAKTPTDRFATIADFSSALRIKDTRSTNLPVPGTPLVGRQRELTEAGALIRAHRLVTLTGPGGSGKTRLAVEIAAQSAEDFPDGVYWVALQALRDSALVEGAIKASLGIDNDLVGHLANKRVLILLDNFEQVIDASGTISALLARAPNASFLVTSREPLHLDAEHRYPVEPLPDRDATMLFAQRAEAVAPGFRTTPAVDQICRRLDGLPLAIELAAARVALLDPDELLTRLERRLPLLASQSRDAPGRQRTLRSAIRWSDELLTPEEQALFRRLAVFGGTFSLKSAEAVCDADLDALESLVLKSLVRRWGARRFGMLETIREYALEQLDELPSAVDVHRRHARFFLQVAESATLSAGKVGPGGFRIPVALEEQDNIRTALAWSLASGSIQLGLDIAGAMELFWVVQDPREGMRWFTALLEHPGAAVVTTDSLAHALRAFGSATDVAGYDEPATRLYERSLALFEQLDDARGRAVLMHRLGIQAMRRGDLARARQLVEASQEIHARNGDLWGLAQTTGTMGAIARDEGDAARAHDLLVESVGLARRAGGFGWWEGGMLAELAMISLHARHIDEAEALAVESLARAEAARDRPGRVFDVGILASVAAERGQAALAGRLWGAIETENVGAPLGGWRRHRDACLARIRSVAGDDFDRGYVEGRASTLEDAASIALAAAGTSAARESPP
ncbi:MAG TPA: protein kinase [Gemmatimonadaceae bacterium]|nr:protein kinase [Gemmatimonadaceae bacterium]